MFCFFGSNCHSSINDPKPSMCPRLCSPVEGAAVPYIREEYQPFIMDSLTLIKVPKYPLFLPTFLITHFQRRHNSPQFYGFLLHFLPGGVDPPLAVIYEMKIPPPSLETPLYPTNASAGVSGPYVLDPFELPGHCIRLPSQRDSSSMRMRSP